MIDADNIFHVLPIDDLEEHIDSTRQSYHAGLSMTYLISDCKCNPKIEYHGEGAVVVHNAFDGREGVEWANEILNK